jgi:hypothetical protein
MNSTAQLYFKTAILLLIVGMIAGIAMSMTHDYRIAPAHAHLNLLGFVVLAVYGAYFGLNDAKSVGRMPKIIWGIHTAATAALFPALSYYSLGVTAVEPILAISSIALLIASLLFAWVVWKPEPAARPITRATA